MANDPFEKDWKADDPTVLKLGVVLMSQGPPVKIESGGRGIYPAPQPKTVDPLWDRYFELSFIEILRAWGRDISGFDTVVKVAGEMADEILAERAKRMCAPTKTVGQLMDGREWLTVAEAKALNVCRICKEDVNKMGGQLILNFGEEFAHKACLAKAERVK